MEHFTFKKNIFSRLIDMYIVIEKQIWREEIPYFLNDAFYLFTLNRAWKERFC